MASYTTNKVLAIASDGGHWVQLLRLRPAFIGLEVVYVSTNIENRQEVEGCEFFEVINANRKMLGNFFTMFLQIFRIIRIVKPHTIITTGAAPGLVALIVGKLFRTKNIWIDSIANVETLSSSGKKARFVADLYLTQWEALQKKEGPLFKGSIL